MIPMHMKGMKNLKRLIRTSLDFFNGFGCRIEALGPARLAYNPRHPLFIREYYLYCVGLLHQVLAAADVPVNVLAGDYAVRFGNGNRTIKLDIQHEHTLVKPGGRDSGGAVRGGIPLLDHSDFYLVRIQNHDYLKSLDLVIDYSLPNLRNAETSHTFQAYRNKAICLAPLLYEPDFGAADRREEIITQFSDTTQSRRKAFLEASASAGLPLRNVRGIFDKAGVRRLFRNTRILVNVHQTEHHHTLEELRILPALLCGVVIVSEDVPLKELIPYSRFIIWSGTKDLVDRVRAVHASYETHRARIFDDPELANVLAKMKEDNRENLAAALRALMHD